jgi:SAM-dependent methyltransferase
MLICPDCGVQLSDQEALGCVKCGWQSEVMDGIPVYLSSEDRRDPVLHEYLENYARIADDDLIESIQDERYLEYQAANLAECVRTFPGAVVCDIGSGKGYLARALLDRGLGQLTVVDISVAYLHRLRETLGIRPVLANAENLPFQEAFDVVATTDVMEHVLNVGSFLYSLNRALKTDGRAYVRVPYRESLLGYSPHLGCPYRFVHLRSFDESILRDYFDVAGFEVEGFRYDGFWLDIWRPFWTKTNARKRVIETFLTWARRRLQHPTEITRWKSWLVGIFLRPVEISVIARKVKRLEASQPAPRRLGTDSR